MKSVYQIAKESGFSQQLIHKKLTIEFLEKMHDHIMVTKHGNKTRFQIDEIGEQAILELLKKRTQRLTNIEHKNYSMLNNNAEYLLLERANEKLREELAREQEQANYLRSELTRDREVINYLRIELAKEREHSRGLSGQLVNITAEVADITRNNQILLGIEQKKGLPTTAETSPINEHGFSNSPKKKGFFSFLRRSK